MNCSRVRAQLGDHLEGDLELGIRTQVNEHLEQCASCATELRELRSTVALIRALPDPEPPASLTEQVMARIAAGEDNVRGLPIVRRVFDPRIALPLAAGIAGLVMFASIDQGPTGLATTAHLVPVTARDVDGERVLWERRPQTLAELSVAQRHRNLAMPRLVGIERASADRFFDPKTSVAGFGFLGRTDPDPRNLDLDGQVDRALRDPMAFARRFGAIAEADRGSELAPLVVRARRRGDATVIAKKLRRTRHPLAVELASHFEPGRRAFPRDGSTLQSPPSALPAVGRPVRLPIMPATHTR